MGRDSSSNKVKEQILWDFFWVKKMFTIVMQKMPSLSLDMFDDASSQSASLLTCKFSV